MFFAKTSCETKERKQPMYNDQYTPTRNFVNCFLFFFFFIFSSLFSTRHVESERTRRVETILSDQWNCFASIKIIVFVKGERQKKIDNLLTKKGGSCKKSTNDWRKKRCFSWKANERKNWNEEEKKTCENDKLKWNVLKTAKFQKFHLDRVVRKFFPRRFVIVA